LAGDSTVMKNRLLIFMMAAAVALAVVAAYWHFSQRPPRNLKLMSAATAFSQALSEKGQAVPSTVSATELITGGYITPRDITGFRGWDVRIWLSARDTWPQSILMSAQLPGGRINAMLADGSIQQFWLQDFQAHLQTSGQQDGAANRSQPVRAETNQTSAGAGSGR
jgi:hypothetical protein